MKLDHALLALAGVLLLVGVGAAAVGVPTVAGVGQDSAFEETSIRSVNTTGPHCSDPRSHNSSTRSHPVPGGRLMSINDTIAVDARDSTVSVDLQEFGPGRHILAIDREPGTETADCHLEIRYNVTLNVSQPQDYTLLVTYDDRLVSGHYGDENSGGGFATSRGSSAGGAASAGAATEPDSATASDASAAETRAGDGETATANSTVGSTGG